MKRILLLVVLFITIIGNIDVRGADYYSNYGSSETISITVSTSKSYNFEVDGIKWYRTTKWYVNGVLKETDESGISAYDPDYSYTFNVIGTTTLIAKVYDGSSLEESHQWNVTAKEIKPDLEVTAYALNKYIFDSGETVDFECTVKNTGDEDCSTFKMGYYLSANSTLSSDDTYLDYNTVSYGLNAGNDTNENASEALPENLSDGTYYILFVADYEKVISESDENNNVEYKQITIKNKKPDLEVTAYALNKYIFDSGETVDFDCTVKNTGDEDCSTFKMGYYLSANSTLSSDDTYLDYNTVSYGLNAGNQTDENASEALPENLSDGTYYILFVADYEKVISESDENNNVEYKQITIKNKKPDLEVTAYALNKYIFDSGETVDFDCTVKNTGDEDCSTFKMGYYLSANSTLSSDDTYLDYNTVSYGLNAGNDTNENASEALPENLLAFSSV